MKPKIILLPSSWANAAVFAPQIEALKNNYEIIVPDLGRWDNVQAMATDIVNEHKHVDCIIGLSLGGFVAQQILIDHPQFTSKAILISTHAHAIDSSARPFYENLMQQVQQGKLAELAPLFANAVLSEKGQQNPALYENVVQMPLRVGMQGCYNHHKASLDFTDKTASLKNINASVLIICSVEDKATPPEFHEIIHQKIPHSELVILEQGGHFVTLEYPQVVNQLMIKWLENEGRGKK